MLIEAIRYLQKFVASKDESEPEQYRAVVVPVQEPQRALFDSRDRLWSYTAQDAGVYEQVAYKAVKCFDSMPPSWIGGVNEATTRKRLIDKVLDELGWEDIEAEHYLGENGRVDYYHSDSKVAVEAKSYDSRYDDISAINYGGVKGGRHVSEQLSSYLDHPKIKALVYTNGRNWWRIERDSDGKSIYALRFDLYLAHNIFKIRRNVELAHIDKFVSFFHCNAFRSGTNSFRAVSKGFHLPYPGMDWVYVKVLNSRHLSRSQERFAEIMSKQFDV